MYNGKEDTLKCFYTKVFFCGIACYYGNKRIQHNGELLLSTAEKTMQAEVFRIQAISSSCHDVCLMHASILFP
jgi:hypothetical protein